MRKICVSVAVAVVCLAIPSQCLAQRGVSIGRYFNNNDTTNSVRDFEGSSVGLADIPRYGGSGGTGVLNSSLPDMPRPVSLPDVRPMPVPAAPQYRQIGDPIRPVTMAPMLPAAPAAAASPGQPLMDTAASLAGDTGSGALYPKQEVLSLAPPAAGAVRNKMLSGEAALKKGDFAAAKADFDAARDLSGNSPESLLDLFHTELAQADGSYAQAAQSLWQTLTRFPKLPMVRVCPKDFYANEGAYQAILQKLQQHLQKSPQDCDALFVLGYLQWRDRQLAEANKSLNDAYKAAKAASNMTISSAALILQTSMSMSAAQIKMNGPDLAEPHDYPWAGIRLALPQGFAPQPLTQINQVVVGLQGELGQEDARTVSLSAFPVAADMALSTILNTAMDRLKADPRIQDLSVTDEADVTLLGHKAIVRLYSGTFSGEKVALGRACFVRPVSGGRGVAYVLGAGAMEKDREAIMPTLATMARSLALIDFRSPLDLPVDKAQASVIRDENRLYSLKLPAGWAGQFGNATFVMGQIDFVRGGVVLPRTAVLVTTVPADATAKSLFDKAYGQGKLGGQVLSHGPAKMSGVEGYQFVVRRSLAAATSAPAGAAESTGQSLEIGRLICVPNAEGKNTMYALVMVCGDATPQQGQAAMDAIADGFEVQAPAK